jgi:hypothetical protein
MPPQSFLKKARFSLRHVGLNGLGYGVGQDRAFFSPKPDGEWQEMPCLICILPATFRSVFVVLPPNFL